jgi:ketosteroid isomerase-like protein
MGIGWSLGINRSPCDSPYAKTVGPSTPITAKIPKDSEVKVKILKLYLVGVVSLVLLVACQGSNDAALAAAQSVMRADNAFSASSAQQGFATAFKQYATDDALLLPENNVAIRGKTTILESLQGMPSGTSLTWSPQGADASGDLGYTWGIYTLTGKNNTGQATAGYGKYLSIWKRQSGSWRLAMMMVNNTPGPAGG